MYCIFPRFAEFSLILGWTPLGWALPACPSAALVSGALHWCLGRLCALRNTLIYLAVVSAPQAGGSKVQGQDCHLCHLRRMAVLP